MKFFKNNFKLIIGIIIGMLFAGGVAYAVTSASDISYTRQGTNINNVADALNDLYNKKSDEKYIWKTWLEILNDRAIQIQPSSIDTDNMIAESTNTAYSIKAKAFNGAYLTGGYSYTEAWLAAASTNNDDYIGYNFNKPVMLYKMTLNYSSYESTGQYSFVLEGKKENGTWEEIGNEYLINANSQFTTNDYNINNNTFYYGYRIKNNYSKTGHGKQYWHVQGTYALAVGELQFYCIEKVND